MRTIRWELVVEAILIAVPVILLVAYIWYLNNSGIYAAIKEGGVRQAARKGNVKTKKKNETGAGLYGYPRQGTQALPIILAARRMQELLKFTKPK